MSVKPKTKKPRRKINVPKECYFCKEKKDAVYSDVETIRRFLTERGKIIGKDRNGLCAKHQRHLTLAIKHARHLGLLPFVAR